MKILSLRRQYPNEGIPAIDWENFLYLAMSLPPKLSLSQIKLAFNAFDKNKSGKISTQELSQLCRDLAITGNTHFIPTHCVEEEESDIRKVVNMTAPEAKLDYQQFLTILTTRPEKLEI
jgi:Ca2+-binding EF-hand superfamily protein